MKPIKGLIMKDNLQLKSYRKTLFIFFLVFFLTSLVQSKTGTLDFLLVFMFSFGMGMYGIASFNYDETTNGNRYLLTLPVSKKKIVQSKYIFIFLSILIGVFFGVLCTYVATFFLTLFGIASLTYPSVSILITNIITSFLVISAIDCFQIPCIYKWGPERGRMMVFIPFAVIGLAVGLFFYLAPSNIDLSFLSHLETYIPFLLIGVIFLIYFISYQVSYRIFNKKEV